MKTKKCLGEGLSFFARRDLGCWCYQCQEDHEIHNMVQGGSPSYIYYSLQSYRREREKKDG